VLSRARRHGALSRGLRDSYSDTCLRRVWQAQHFAHVMTTALHTEPEISRFDTRLQLARLHHIAGSAAASAEPAEHYTGLPIG
jgi:p-hydroxybenzoate 3-monooxygenase